MIRLYEPKQWQAEDSLILSDNACHHIRNVLRAEVNDHLILFNGQGGEYEAEITEIAKKRVTVKIIRYLAIERESPLTLHLAQGLTRSDKMDYIVQKATELGVTSITPIVAERSQGRLSTEQAKQKITRLQQIAIAACEQCGRNRPPPIHAPVSMREWLEQTANIPHRYLLLPTIIQQQKEADTTQPSAIHLLIGPEGGFTVEENNIALKSGCRSLTLGSRILRTETASLAAIAVMQWQYGDFSQ